MQQNDKKFKLKRAKIADLIVCVSTTRTATANLYLSKVKTTVDLIEDSYCSKAGKTQLERISA